jgi:hypothetical protein
MDSRGVLKSVLFGMMATMAIGVAAFSLTRFFDAVGLYILPAGWLLPVIGPIVQPVVNWLLPEGAGPAGVLLILICTALFWTVSFAFAHFAWSRSKNWRGAA